MKKFCVLLGTALAALAASAPAALADTEVVREADVVRQPENTPPTNNWVIYTRNAGSAAFTQGPGTAPLGAGSLQFTTPTSADKVVAFNYDHVGTRLADVDAMSYSTYRVSGAVANQVPALNMEVDYNGSAPGGFTTLVFEPVYNTDQGAVTDGEWQGWDAYDGGGAIWWSTRSIPGVCAFDCFVAWDAIVAANPDATILGGFGVNQGSGNPALTAHVDALTIGAAGDATTYDFEPSVGPPTSKDDCKDGGWMRYDTPRRFANQGDCVSYVATGGKHG